MPQNGLTQIDLFENIGVDVPAGGFGHPRLGVKQGYFLGFSGSAARSSTTIPELAVQFRLLEETITIAAAATSTGTGNLLPANSIIHPFGGRVTVTIPTAATFGVGVTGSATRFATAIAVAAGTTFAALNHWSGASTTLALGPSQVSLGQVLITPNATPANANGRVVLQVLAETVIPPTA